MGLWLKKPSGASGTFVQVSKFWVKKPAYVGDTTGTWTQIKKAFVKRATGWTIFWPKIGPSTSVAPLISTIANDVNGTSQPPGFSLDYGTTYYGQRGVWDTNDTGLTISSYSYKIYCSTSNVINTSPYELMDSGTLSGVSQSIPLTSGLTSGTTYDGKSLIFEVTALRSDGISGTDNTDSNNYRYFICRKYPPTQASGYSSSITSSATIGTSTLSGGILKTNGAPITLSYTNSWNGTTNYLPDSTRSSVKWYSSLNGTYTTSAQIIANGTLITSGITTPSPSNSGGIYTTSSTYITGSSIPDGTYYYVIDSQQNSNSDYYSGVAVSQITKFGPVQTSPTPTTQPTLTAITPAGYIGKTNSFTIGATVYGNTGIWSPTPNGIYPVVSSFQISSTSDISNQTNWSLFNFNTNGSGTLYGIIDSVQNQTHSFTINSIFYDPVGNPYSPTGKYLEYGVSAMNGANSLQSDYYTNAQKIYPVPYVTGAPVLTNYTESNGNVTPNKATVYWSQNLYSSHHYELQYSLNNSTNWTTVYPTPNNIITTNPGLNSQLVYTGLPNLAYYRVVAYNEDNVGIASSSTYFDSNKPYYQFTSGNTIYVGTNGYISFDQGNSTFNITQTVGRVLGYLPADLQLDYLKYAAIKDFDDYWYVVWQGRRLGSGTNSELRVELLFKSGSQYAWAYYTIGGSVTGTFVNYPYGFYKDGLGINTSSGGISNGSNVMYSLNSASGFLALPPSWFPYGTSWAGLNVLTGSEGVSSGTVDDGYYSMSTFVATPPAWISSTVTAPTANMTSTTAYLFWTVPVANGGSQISSYDYKLGSGGTWINVGNTTLTQLTGLTPNTTYTAYVRARNYGYGFASTDPNGDYWRSVTFTTPVSAPINISAPSITGSNRTFNVSNNGAWNPDDADGIYGYQWQYNDQGSTWLNISGTYSTTGSSTGSSISLNTSLFDNLGIRCQVTATNAGGSTPATSNTLTITAPLTKLATPTGVSATTTRTDGINITWNAVANAAYYGIWYGSVPSYDFTPDFGGPGNPTLITGTSYLDTSVGAGSSRTYYVQAYRTSNPTGTKSDWSSGASGTRTVAVSNATPPTSVTATGTNGGATVSWSGATNAVKYRIWWSTSPTGYASDPSTSYDAETTSTSYSFSGFTNGTTYYFWVSASNTNNVWTNYSASPRGQATPAAAGVAPSAPTGLSNTYGSGPSWTGSWTASSTGTAPITYYWTLYQSLTSGGAITTTASGSTTGTSFSQTMNSANGLWAYFTVYASNAYGNSGTATSSWA